MKIYKNPNLKKNHCNGVIAIGNFDGLHLGHQKVIKEAKQKAKIDNSTILANLIQDQFANRAGIRSRGVKQAPFQVLWNTTMPSVLIETGFMTNPTEERKLNDKTHRVYIASAIFRAIRDYKNYLESNV